MPSALLTAFDQAVETHLPGRTKLARMSLAAMMAGGHILIEDIPGMGKTTFALILARLCGLQLNRIQCTNDMLPSDILGQSIWHPARLEFFFKAGPIFSPFLLVDELNRAPSKSQSALLQAMEERRLSVDGKELLLPRPFIVLATQNPGNSIGTNPLPESQIDRFCISFFLEAPTPENELKMLQTSDVQKMIAALPEIFSADWLLAARQTLEDISIHPELLQYLLRLLAQSRSWPDRAMVLSTRAGRDLLLMARALALLQQERAVMPHHLSEAFPYIAGHRLGGQKGVQFGQELAQAIVAQVPLA